MMSRSLRLAAESGRSALDSKLPHSQGVAAANARSLLRAPAAQQASVEQMEAKVEELEGIIVDLRAQLDEKNKHIEEKDRRMAALEATLAGMGITG